MERSRILVVDADEQVLDRFRRLLHGDYDAQLTTNWEQGIELLEHNAFAVVIASNQLPWLGGVEFLQRTCALQPHSCRILVGSAPKTDQIITAINSAHIHYYLALPWQAGSFKRILAHEIENYHEQQRLQTEHSHYRTILFDTRTRLSNRALLMDSAAIALRRDGFLAMLWLDATPLWEQQASLTRRDFDGVTEQLFGAIRSLPSTHLREADRLAVDEAHSPRFCVIMGPPRDERISNANDAHCLATRLQHYLNHAVAGLSIPRLMGAAVRVGWNFALFDPALDCMFQVQQVCDRARDAARRMPGSGNDPTGVQQLRRILDERCIRTLFQPIAALADRTILGYEALSRGPAGSILESPEALLDMADEAGLTFELDRLFRSMALTNTVELPTDKKIFINTLTSTAHDPDMAATRLSRFLRHLGIDPTRVVFEFSERCNIVNHEVWVETLQNYRSVGVQLAIDDVGAGYSGLERIVAIRPDYIKIDRSLVQDVHMLPVKRSVLQALVHLGATLNAEVIAEGIEHGADLDCLLQLGVRYGQGHLFGRPAHPVPRGWGNMIGLNSPG